MILWRILVYPFAVIYDGITRLRNFFYNKGFLKTTEFSLPIISVGNLSVGGTGKTPHVEFILNVLSDFKLATLSRGYGRKTKGYRKVVVGDDASTVGDEPLQIFQKYGAQSGVYVGEKRVLAVPKILADSPDIDAVLLDDAYQHRAIGRRLNVLLTDFNRLFYQDFVLPAGYLREARKGALRADVIVVTKCPSGISQEAIGTISAAIAKYKKENAQVFFSQVIYSDFEHVYGPEAGVGNCVLVSGIAHSEGFVTECKNRCQVLEHFDFGDHHAFKFSEVEEIVSSIQELNEENPVLVTTEKDWMRLNQPEFHPILKNITVFCLPIRVEFLQDEAKFKTLLKNAITNHA